MSLNSLLKLLLVGALTTSCSTFGNKPESGSTESHAHKTYGEIFYTDGNRAPASMSPPTDLGTRNTTVDPMHLQTQADYHFALGEAYSLDSNSNRAVEEFKLTLVYDPNSPTVHLKLAGEYIKKGLISEAIDQAEEAVKIDSNYADARLLLGGLYASVKMYDKAMHQYTEVVRLKPDSLDPFIYMGALLAEQGKYTEAISLFEKVAKRKDLGSTHVAYFYIGRIYSEKKDKEKAREYFEKSLKVKPDFIEAVMALGSWYEKNAKSEKVIQYYSSFQEKHGPNERVAEPLAKLYMEQEQYDKALRQYEIIANSDPDNLNAKVKIALILIERKDYNGAIGRLKDILVMAPDSDKIRFYLGAVFEEVKDYRGAIEQFLKIPSVSAFYEESIVHAAYLHKLLDESNRAINVLEEAIHKKPELQQFYALYASLLDEKKEFKRAVDMLAEATTRFPKNEQLLFFLGSMYDKVGDRKNTVQTMKRVLDLNRDHVQALNYLAYTFAEGGTNLDEAEALAKRAVDIKNDDAYIRDTLGWVFYKRGDFAAAIRELELAFKIKGTESIIAEHLGDAYFSHQLMTKARDMYLKAVELESDASNMQKIRGKIDSIDRSLSRERLPASLPASASKNR